MTPAATPIQNPGMGMALDARMGSETSAQEGENPGDASAADVKVEAELTGAKVPDQPWAGMELPIRTSGMATIHPQQRNRYFPVCCFMPSVIGSDTRGASDG